MSVRTGSRNTPGDHRLEHNEAKCDIMWFEIGVKTFKVIFDKVRKRAKIRNRYNQVPHLTKNTNGKVTDSQLDNTNECQEVSPFPAGDHTASINRRTRKHNKHKTEIT